MTEQSSNCNPQAAVAFVALGSNMGDSENLLRQAMERLARFSTARLRKSSLWQTTPVNCPPGSPPFLNAVVGLVARPGETPETLLAELHRLEREFGRTPKMVLNEPRRLDLDLIAFNHETRNTPSLTLPHPRAHQRRFVLQPLSEIAPDLILPGQPLTISELLAALRSDEKLARLD